MDATSNDILKRELTLEGKNDKSFKLTIIKEDDEIIFESNILDNICNIQYTKKLNIKQFYENNKIFKKYKSINELYSKIFENIEEKEIIMSLNNNKIEANLMIDNNKILLFLEQKEIKLDNKIINKINEYIDILKNENNNLRKEIKQQKDDNEKNIKELKNEIENIKKELSDKNKVNEDINNILNNELNHNQIIKDIKKENNKIKEKVEDVEYQINNIKQNLAGQMPTGNSNMMNNNPMNNTNYMNMNMPMNNMNYMNMNMPMNNMNYMNMNMPMNNTNYMNMNMPINNMNMMNTKPNSSSGNKISITFEVSTGSKVTLEMETSTTIEEMIKEYAKEINLPEKYLGRKVIFLYTGQKLDFKSKQTIGSMFNNNALICVFDQGLYNLWTINFEASTGSYISMKIDKSETIKDMIEAYVNRVGVPKKAIGKEIIFWYNGKSLDYKTNDSVEKVLKNGEKITVLDHIKMNV